MVKNTNPEITPFGLLNHSERRLLVGFANAAFIAWKLTVINAIAMVNKPAMANTHQLILIL